MAKLFILFTAVALVFMLGLGIGSGYASQGSHSAVSGSMGNMSNMTAKKTFKD